MKMQVGLCDGQSMGYCLWGCWLCFARAQPGNVGCMETEGVAPKEEVKIDIQINPSQVGLCFENTSCADSNRKEANVLHEVRLRLPRKLVQ